MTVHFQLILKTAVYPKVFLEKSLRAALAADSSAIGDYDIENIKDWIEIQYYSSYPNSKRKVLGFTLSIPDEIPEGEQDKIINENFGKILQPERGQTHSFIENVIRYQDDAILADIQRYHPPIFEIEMRVREVINYIFSFNLPHHRVWQFLKEFQGIYIKTKSPELLDKFENFFENEVFHIMMTDYGRLTNPKQREISDFKVKINDPKTKDLAEVKNWLKQAVDFSQFNIKHQMFLNNVSNRLKPIEDLRNDIMHNRKIHQDVIKGFEAAIDFVNPWIDKFWEDEKLEEFMSVWEVVYFLLDTIFESANLDSNDELTFLDFDFQEQSLWIDDFQESYLPETIQSLIESQFGIRLDSSESELRKLEKEIQQRINSLY